jgi:HSP20 family protein
MQQGGGRQMGRDLASRRGGSGQPTILPAMMANPGLMTRALLANPFAFAQAMSEEMDRVFSMADRGDVWQQVGQPGQQSGRGSAAGWSPALEVVQKENELVVCADLPGLKPDDVQIDIEDHVLTISGERREKHEDRREGIFRSERSYGSFTRSIALPEGVDEEQVTANFEHGELEVRIPLPDQQKSRGRRVQIQSGASSTGAGKTAAGNAGAGNTGTRSEQQKS